jgi:hypothetical protein
MGQFTAFVYQEDRRFRIVVDGLGSGSAWSLFEAEDVARRIIERHVRASYPERSLSAVDTAVGAMNFHIEVVRSDGSRERRQLWLRTERGPRDVNR